MAIFTPSWGGRRDPHAFGCGGLQSADRRKVSWRRFSPDGDGGDGDQIPHRRGRFAPFLRVRRGRGGGERCPVRRGPVDGPPADKRVGRRTHNWTPTNRSKEPTSEL